MIYPPTLQSTQPAFLTSSLPYEIGFTLQNVTALNDIKHVQVRVVQQSNNKTIVNTDKYPDGIIYKNDFTESSVEIRSDDLILTGWTAGYLYKVQVRFGTNVYDTTQPFVTWKQEQINLSAFSEWSNVMVIKAIAEPAVTLLNAASAKLNTTSTRSYEASLTPLFQGQCVSSDDAEDMYCFELWQDGALLETSGWKSHFEGDGLDQHRFAQVLVNGDKYSVIYRIRTINDYEASAEAYTFEVAKSYVSELKGVTLTAQEDAENGRVLVGLTTNTDLNGTYVLSRASEATNYEVWEDIRYFTWGQTAFNGEVIYQDYTLESGVQYKYAFQNENELGMRTSPVYANNGNTVCVNLEYAYLYRDGVQLKLKFNQKMSSFKHSTLTAKQDTLGSQYPYLSRNGNAYYAEFPIAGLISFQMDEDQTFFTLQDKGFYYKDELILPRNKFAEVATERVPCSQNSNISGLLSSVTNYNSLAIDSSLSDNNIFIERKFREKVEEFLNDFDYKLYRSATEGNIVVGLMNVSLTPNSTLGRMVYEFTATAYEVMDSDLESLDEVGVIDIGGYETLENKDTSISFGQITGLYGQNIDVLALIKQQEEKSLENGYKTSVKELRAVRVEGHPISEFKEELLELEAQLAELKNAGEDPSAVEAAIKKHNALQEALQGPSATTTILKINGREVIILPNKTYTIRESITSLEIVSAISPIIVNYVCTTVQAKDTEVGIVSAVEATKVWGQVSGVFTTTDNVLKVYKYDYDANGQYCIDSDKGYNVYKTVNLFAVIEEEARHQIEDLYGVSFTQSADGSWTSGNVIYSLSDITKVDIEADAGTILLISNESSGANAQEIMVGPTGRYVLNPIDSMVKYLTFKEPTYSIVDFRCTTNQITMTKESDTHVRVLK